MASFTRSRAWLLSELLAKHEESDWPQFYNVSISANVSNFNVDTHIQSLGWDGVKDVMVIVTIQPGVRVNSTTYLQPAFNSGTLTPNSKLFIVNKGEILGAGGVGGAGGSNSPWGGTSGTKGGNAIRTIVTTYIMNTGVIKAGGGGGGGGAAKDTIASPIPGTAPSPGAPKPPVPWTGPGPVPPPSGPAPTHPGPGTPGGNPGGSPSPQGGDTNPGGDLNPGDVSPGDEDNDEDTGPSDTSPGDTDTDTDNGDSE